LETLSFAKEWLMFNSYYKTGEIEKEEIPFVEAKHKKNYCIYFFVEKSSRLASVNLLFWD
jgi:hypothetical protein